MKALTQVDVQITIVVVKAMMHRVKRCVIEIDDQDDSNKNNRKKVSNGNNQIDSHKLLLVQDHLLFHLLQQWMLQMK